MRVIVINHRESFEILPSVCLSRILSYWILMISWGTMTIELDWRGKDNEQ